jgi:hypothetical protein
MMRFDSADVTNLVAAVRFDEVILHEMGTCSHRHYWDHARTEDGFNYLGPNALAEYKT